MLNTILLTGVSLGGAFLLSASAFGAELPAPPKQTKSEPPGLRGNTLPQCPEGQYVASMICKSALPGYYLEHGMKYPVQCPAGMTSPYGAKAKTYCYQES